MKSPRITLCGRLSVLWDGEELEGSIPGRQGRLLFAYLALNRKRPVRRDELVEALWADEGLPSGGDALLAPPLSRLRKALGPGRLEGRSELNLALGDDPWIDWEAAQTALENAQRHLAAGKPDAAWDEALEAEGIFSSGLLPGLEARWIDEHRVLLEEYRLESLEAVALSGAGLGASEQSRAERAARTAIEASPFRESARAAQIEVMRAQGNIAEALRAYEDLRVLLRDELGTPPSPKLNALYEKLLNAHESDEEQSVQLPVADGPASTIAPVPPTVSIARRIDPAVEDSPLIGRDGILNQLDDELAQAARGELRIALLTGEGGLGKTRLAAEFASRCENTTILYGRCEPEDVRPFGIWIGLLRSALRQTREAELPEIIGADGPTLSRLLPELVNRLDISDPRPATDVESERMALFGAVLRLIGRMSTERPMLIILDDLQWADRSTLRLLRQLASDDPPKGVLALGMYRDTEVKPGSDLVETVTELRRKRPSTRIALDALDSDEIRELVGDRVSGDLATTIHDQTGGNPFFIGQLVQHMEESGNESPGSVPAGVRDVINHRVARLPDGGPELLARATLIGQDFDLQVLEATTSQSEDEVIDLLDSATAAGLLNESPTVPGRYSFSHALLRSTLEQGLSLTRRTTVHRNIGEALELRSKTRPDRHLGELAWHFTNAGPSESDRAVHYATLAAEQAEDRLAFDEAVDFYAGAIRACRADEPVDQGLLARLLLSLATALWKNGMLQEAGDTFFEAADAARESGLPDLLAEAALGTTKGGWDAFDSDMGKQIALFQESLDGLGEGESVLKARIMAYLAQMLFYGAGRAAEALALGNQALRMISRFDDPRGEISVLGGTAFLRWEPQMRGERLPVAERLVKLAGEVGEEELLAHELASRSLAHLNLGHRLEAAADRARHAEMSATLPPIRVTAGAIKAVDCFIAGEWQEGERITLALLESGVPRAAGLLIEDALRFMVKAQQGRLNQHLDRLEPMIAASLGWDHYPAWRLGLLLARAQDGQTDAVREEMAGFTRSLNDIGEPNATFLAFLGIGNLLTSHLGDAATAARLAKLIEPFTGEWIMIGRIGSTLGPVELHLGELQLLAGNVREAATALERSLVTCEAMSSAPYLARTRLALAEALNRLDDPDGEARSNDLRQAGLLAATELGMKPVLQRYSDS